MSLSNHKNAAGPTIRKLRNQHGWTQDQLAAKLQVLGWDCTRSWLAKIEARQVYLKDYEVLYFREVFNIDLGDLFSTLSARKADPRQRKNS